MKRILRRKEEEDLDIELKRLMNIQFNYDDDKNNSNTNKTKKGGHQIYCILWIIILSLLSNIIIFLIQLSLDCFYSKTIDLNFYLISIVVNFSFYLIRCTLFYYKYLKTYQFLNRLVLFFCFIIFLKEILILLLIMIILF